MTSKTILVTGAAGAAGRSYVTAFARAGHRVRAAVRPGLPTAFDAAVEVRPTDLHDAAASRAAVEGSDVVVLALAGRGRDAAADEAAITRNVARAASVAGVGHLIYTSVHRADEPTGVPHFEVKGVLEQDLADLVEQVTVLRPTTFADSLTAPWLRDRIVEQGVLASPIGLHTPISYVATEDLARVAVASLSAEELRQHPVVVTGSRPATYADLLPLLEQLSGRAISYEQIPAEVVRRSFGTDLAAMTAMFNSAGFAAEPSPILHDLQLVPQPVQDFLRESWTPPSDPTPGAARLTGRAG
jgi:uncharacterized protein YbjT (DUF2867 family)